MSIIKGNRAFALQKKGQKDEAIRLYEEAIAEGLNDPRYLMPYALLIIRDGQYQKAKDFLVAHQRVPGMSPQQRTELLVYYAVCCLRLGCVDKGINALEQQAQKGENGLIYQTLGYLYVDKYDLANKPDFTAVAADTAEAESADGTENEAAEKPLTPEEEWNAGVEKAGEFIRKSVEYDDEDSICLDNMAQYTLNLVFLTDFFTTHSSKLGLQNLELITLKSHLKMMSIGALMENVETRNQWRFQS